MDAGTLYACLMAQSERIAELEAENKQLREVEDKINDLEDRFQNGIKYDENYNHYILCWTERELELAKVRAEELAKFFKKALEET
jgi:hypothetical protein